MLLAELLRAEGDLIVGENEPYRVSDLTDYTIPVHGERRGLPHVEIEIRQDLIADPAGQTAWAERLARLLPAAYARIPAPMSAPSREVPIDSAHTALLFIDVQNFCVRRRWRRKREYFRQKPVAR